MTSERLRLRGRHGAALLALLAVALATVFWAQQAAHADIPTGAPGTTIKVDGGVGLNNLAPGEDVSYQVKVHVPAWNYNSDVAQTANLWVKDPSLETTNPTATVQFDTDLLDGYLDSVPPNVQCTWPSTNKLSCTWDPKAAGYTTPTDFEVDLHFHAPGNDGTYIADPTGSACHVGDSDTPDAVTSCSSGTADNAEYVVIAPEGDSTNPVGMQHTIVFNLDANVTCQSDSAVEDNVRTCNASDVNLDAGETLVSGPTIADTNVDNATTVSVTIVASAAGNYDTSLNLLSNSGTDDPGHEVPFVTNDFVKTYIDAYITHIKGGLNGDDPTQNFDQDVVDNVRGNRHTVCVVDEFGNGLIVPLSSKNDVHIQSGGGATSVNDPDPTFTDPQFFTESLPLLDENGHQIDDETQDATCFSWVSTEAGDQEITAQYKGSDGNYYQLQWVDAPSNLNNQALVKEWNVLENSAISINGAVQTNPDGSYTQSVVKSSALTLVPSAPNFPHYGGVEVEDHFIGSHIDRTGKLIRVPLTGVIYDVTLDSGSCGGLYAYDPTGLSGVTDEETGIYPQFYIDAYADNYGEFNCSPGQSTSVTITGSEPSPLGSGTGKTVTEHITITWVEAIAHKNVMLAWAGQRVVLEHDWRIPAGDYPDGYPAAAGSGICPLVVEGGPFNQTYAIQYIKGGGPGNFISGLGAFINGSDQAIVDTFGNGFHGNEKAEFRHSSDQQQDAPMDPQNSCISRVLFESEQPGQVDVEAFAVGADGLGTPPQVADQGLPPSPTVDLTKVAFVIYYMKLHSVNVSLVSQVSKPTHNGYSEGYDDYTPGNPWDATKDDADNAVDWNVSKDLLVRVRVTGWFLNENPSGRAADSSNPLNVLPADRWVMPQDWAILAGGPADPADGSDAVGTAEQFRPYYDIMFAPNNKAGLTLVSPSGVSGAAVAVTLTNTATGLNGTGSSTNPMIVSTTANISAGTYISVDACVTTHLVDAVAPNVLFLDVPYAVAPAAGTVVYVCTGVPFEGPMSLIDIPGLAAGNGGVAGAALSNILGSGNSVTRDTILADGDVDWWDAPMPPAPVTVSIRGTGFLKQVQKADVYYNGTANTAAQNYPDPFYLSNIPDSPYIPAIVAGGGYYWDSWGGDGPQADDGFASSFPPGLGGQGPYWFWTPVRVNVNPDNGSLLDPLLASSTKAGELAYIGAAYGDVVGRDFTVYTDNHGEAMVTANGDFNTDLSACASNALGGGKLCKPGDKVGTGTITATADYPDFRGKHPPVLSNTATVTWTWGGYKDVTIEQGEDPQFKYVVFHAMDRDGFCYPPTGGVLLHPVLTGSANDAWSVGTLVNPSETVDFLIDSGEGIILGTSGGSGSLNSSGNRQFATGVATFSTAVNTVIKEFPLSSLAPAGATDECQAWIKISNSLLSVTDVLATAHDDEGDVGFDRVVDLQNTATYTLNFRWSLVTWNGADNIPVTDALHGTGANDAGNDIFSQVTAVYGWDASAQAWLGFFPAGVNVPGANDLVNLKKGAAYWIAITGPSSVSWTIATSVL